MLLSQEQVLGIELLVGGGVYDLGIDLFLVVAVGVEAAPDDFAAAGGEADAVYVEGVKFWCLFGDASSKGNFSD